MRGALSVLAAVAALAGCGGEEDDDELPPGSVARIGVASAPGSREVLVRKGVQVAAAAINAAGGIGGAARIELVVGPVERLLDRGVRLLILPCDARRARRAALVASRTVVVAMAPCDDGTLPAAPNVFPTGLSPGRQAEVLAAQVDGRGAVLEADSERGKRVQNALQRLLEGPGSAVLSPEAPERVLPPTVAQATLFATYGFPEPGSETDEFYERFKALFGRRPTSIVAALAADALTVLVAAVEVAGKTEPEAVAEVMRDEGVEVAGVLGTVKFPGGTMRPEVSAVVLRVEDGRYRLVGRAD